MHFGGAPTVRRGITDLNGIVQFFTLSKVPHESGIKYARPISRY